MNGSLPHPTQAAYFDDLKMSVHLILRVSTRAVWPPPGVCVMVTGSAIGYGWPAICTYLT